MRPHNITIIQVNAPTPDHEDEEVEQFYKQIDSITEKTPKEYMFVVPDDWNAKAGKQSKTGQGQQEDLASEGHTTEDGDS